ncbi:MAG TPA: cytochrome c [Pyrinomonadaceae bacterium]|jgi:mono/diheme cytochrome c family protein|nr:cytochrome c [Pyrinomonadaceae bacterium]
MKRIAQFIAAGGLAIPLAIISWTTGITHTAAPLAPHGEPQATDQTPSTSPTLAARDAGAVFDSKCAPCHGKDGRAKTLKAKFDKARNLTDATWQAEVSDERVFNSIANGHGKKMPAFGKELSRAELEGLVGYVRSLKK